MKHRDHARLIGAVSIIDLRGTATLRAVQSLSHDARQTGGRAGLVDLLRTVRRAQSWAFAALATVHGTAAVVLLAGQPAAAAIISGASLAVLVAAFLTVHRGVNR